MVTPARRAEAPPAWRRIQTLNRQLRELYQDTFWPAHHDASATRARYELPDGTSLDPAYAADAAACRAINDTLADTIEFHLPGAVLIDRVDEAPTVIDSIWRYTTADGERLDVSVQWDYRYRFGDPDGLSVRADKAGTR